MSHPGNIAQGNNHTESPVDFIFIFIFNNIHEKKILNILAESNAVFNTKQCKKEGTFKCQKNWGICKCLRECSTVIC